MDPTDNQNGLKFTSSMQKTWWSVTMDTIVSVPLRDSRRYDRDKKSLNNHLGMMVSAEGLTLRMRGEGSLRENPMSFDSRPLARARRLL